MITEIGRKTRLAAHVAIFLIMAGCATTPAERDLKAVEAARERQAEVTKESIGQVPDWYAKLPQDTEATIYAVATAVSQDMQFAVDKATQDAKVVLASRMGDYVSAKMKQFVAETGSGDNASLLQDANKVSASLFTSVSLAGYRVEKQQLSPLGGKYRAFVLLAYPVGEANRLLVEKLRQNEQVKSSLEASKAYKELADEIERVEQRR
jgi:hypothetical protein